jgi:DNA-directed RNA polymerase subunit RPC12/RpoP
MGKRKDVIYEPCEQCGNNIVYKKYFDYVICKYCGYKKILKQKKEENKDVHEQ